MRTLSSLLCQPAPNTAETTELGAMRTQSSIPQFLHTNETSENLSNALHTLLIHCLRLSAGPSATLGVRVCAVRRRPEVARSAALTSAGSHNSATSAPHPVGFPTGYPAFRHFFLSARQPWGGEGRASGSRNAFLPPQQLACVRVGALAHVTPARACENRRGARPGRNRRHREFANTKIGRAHV